MKTKEDNPRQHQSPTTLRVQQEPSTGGQATIVDNRPSTVHQRELQATMHNSPRATQERELQAMMRNSPRSQEHAALRATMKAQTPPNALPVQRKTPKGSSRFQQLATAMGEQHGVDTSGLEATHNSSFPAKLNAEATIQGNNIHFAPGKDSDYNIRHEVSHAIDNALHGTPQGDIEIANLKIDTTREATVDGMAKAPLQMMHVPAHTQHGHVQSEPVGENGIIAKDPRLVNRPTPLVALRPASIIQCNLSSTQLNVVGETHASADQHLTNARRAKKENLFPGLQPYDIITWSEARLNVSDLNDRVEEEDAEFGDSPMLDIALNISDLIFYLGLGSTQANNRNNKITDIRNTLRDEDDAATSTFYTNNINASQNRPDNLSLDNYLEALQQDLQNAQPTVLRNDANGPTNEYQALINPYITGLTTWLQELTGGNLDLTSQDYTNLSAQQQRNEKKDGLDWLRSINMHNFANRHVNNRGIWYIGQSHVVQIQQLIEASLVPPANYNLMTETEHVDELVQDGYLTPEERTAYNADRRDGAHSYHFLPRDIPTTRTAVGPSRNLTREQRQARQQLTLPLTLNKRQLFQGR